MLKLKRVKCKDTNELVIIRRSKDNRYVLIGNIKEKKLQQMSEQGFMSYEDALKTIKNYGYKGVRV